VEKSAERQGDWAGIGKGTIADSMSSTIEWLRGQRSPRLSTNPIPAATLIAAWPTAHAAAAHGLRRINL